MFRWRIYYGDGSVYDNRMGPPWAAPAANVQVIINFDRDHGWSAEKSYDYYWYIPEEDCWQAGDIFGLWDYLSQPGMKKVVFGRILPLSVYQDILRTAFNDPDIPKKTAWRQGEVPAGGL